MSRIIRRKSAQSVRAAKKRRGSDTSSSLDLSGEEGYSGVDEISDDDEEEEDVDAAEEENIVTRGYPSSPATTSRPQFTPIQDEEEDEDEEDEDDDEEEDDDDEDGGYHFNDNDDDNDDGGSAANDDDVESTSWAGIVSGREDSQSEQVDIDDYFQDADYGTSTKIDRHVRFDLPDQVATDDDSTDDDYAGMYTDIFVDQKHLDPAFRREVEYDPDESSGSGSYWDYADQTDFDTVLNMQMANDDHDADTRRDVGQVIADAVSIAPEPVLEASEPSDLDGYETDGETTEEEEIEHPVRRKTRRPSLRMGSPSDEEVDTSVQAERGKPRVGRFRLDKCSKKPTVVLNPVTRKLMILTPHNRRQLDLSPEQFQGLPMFPIDEPTSPMLSNSASMMISAMSMFSTNTFADFINGQAVAGPEAFFSDFNGMESDASMEDQRDLDSGEDDGERNLDLSDFIAFEDSDSSDEEGDKTKNWEPSSTPARPTTASSDVDILSHLNSHTVGAFRRNQVEQQLLLSNQATQDSLAFSGPYNHTAIRGLRSDRFDTAGVPLTPVRRRKNTLTETSRSPLETVSSKRKASSEAQNGGHKKQRSISDVNMLRI